MAEPEVVNVVREYREGLAENERDMLRRMARLWVEPYRYFEKQVNALADEISKRRESGQPVYPDYVYSLERYKSMMEQAQKRIDQYNRSVLGLVTGEETEAAEIGHESAKEPVNLAEPDAPMWTRVNQREARIAAGMTADGSPLERLLAKSYDLTREKLEQTLVTGLAVGQGSGYIARQLMDAFEMPEQRALLIARTEVNRAYRLANWETMKSSKAVKGYRRMCYAPTACFACLVLDGEFYPLNSAPCDHPNGKCSFVPVTEHYDPIDAKNWKRGQDWLMEQDEETQRRIMGAGRFELWKDRGIDPRDMVYIKENPTWGGSPTVKTLEELKMLTNISNTNGGLINQKISESGTVINPMKKEDYRRITSALNRQGVEVYAATDGDDLRYMLAIGAEGTYSNGRITHIGSIPSRGTYFEEIIHMWQSRKYGELDSTDTIELYAREIEANRKLLKYNKAYQLDNMDVADIERNLATWEENFQKAAGLSYDESDYRANH